MTLHSIRLISLSLMILCGIAPLCAQWYQQQVPTRNSLRDVHFVDPNNGWAVGGGVILHTSNGGTTWEIQNSGYPQSLFTAVFAISKNLCWVAGGDTLALKTTNGGKSWMKLPFDVPFDTDWVPQGVVFADSIKGWISGYYYYVASDSEFVLQTTDGGTSWHKQYYIPAIRCTGYHISAVDTQHAWVACNSSIMRTTDGFTWSVASSPLFPGYSFLDVDFLNERVGWATNTDIGLTTEVEKSTDGGLTWTIQKQYGCSNARIFLSFPDTLHGWVVQLNCISVNIWNTGDGGNSWLQQLSIASTYEHLPWKIYFADTLHGWMVGDSGMVWHTTNGGVTAIKDNPEILPREIVLRQNFPNPFNPVATIEYSIPVRAYVTLRVYNLLGQEIATLVNEKKNPGTYSTVFNAERHPGGVYFYRLSAGSYSAVKKMVLMK